MGSGKPRGLHAARKLRNKRVSGRWADKQYKKRVLATRWKADPLQKCSHAKGIVVEKYGIEAKQPNSALRKGVRVQLVKNGKKVGVFVPRDGCLNFIDDNDEVLISGFGRSGHACGDLPGVRFKVVKVAGISLRALYLHKKEKVHT
ncbi:MAG: putative 40S ribosomal protein S23 [Streblomastix strix]|uniref:Putative 40S ribosomal protein S23 n=1 Tax=Streblomastix strix TaxID=222440 RepID=A0A5J4WIL2_9EUKA|nr:MAG: putative 40S ribosomal protein S23 [Streblomastix strix]